MRMTTTIAMETPMSDDKGSLKTSLDLLLEPVTAREALGEHGFRYLSTPVGPFRGAMALCRDDGDQLFAWLDHYPHEEFVLGPRLQDHASAVGRLPGFLPRGHASARLAEIWGRRWPADKPPERWMDAARLWSIHESAMSRLNPGFPHLDLDGFILEAIATRLRQQVATDPNLPLGIVKLGQLCVLWAGRAIYAVQAVGPWHVEARCSAAEFVAALPQRLPERFRVAVEPGILAMGEPGTLDVATIDCAWT